jgi:serine/threonine-protein kinase
VALDRAHENGIVHRDVKPANLLLDGDGNVHVSDFGIASASGADMLTAPGTVLGTAGYISPEQARGEPATPASDRYALGIVAFELLTGRRPFAGDTPTTEAFAHLNAAIPRAVDVDPTLPARLDSVFESALAKDPDARPATARELVERLRAALDTEPVPAPAPAETKIMARPRPGRRSEAPTRGPVRRHRRSRRPRALLAVLAALVALALGLAIAAIVTTGDDLPTPKAETTRERTAIEQPAEEKPAEEKPARPSVDGAALNRDGYARMQAGDYAAALPLLRGAVLALKGSNTLDEAYASYNLAFSRFAVGRCDGVAGLLGRSERIQGHRTEIDELQREWEARCVEGSDDGRGAGEKDNGKGKGKGKGHDRDES